MKLLLTSNGLSNQSIIKSLLSLLGKPVKDIKVVIIPTAANIVPRSKNWLITDMYRFGEIFSYIDIVDIAALSKEDWEPRLTAADVLVFCGGNPFYLKYWIESSGLDKLLFRWMSEKVIVGISAGSMVMGKYLAFDPKDESIRYLKDKEQTGLNVVDFSLLPHLKEADSEVTSEMAERGAKRFNSKIYAVDDDTALCVNDDRVKVISEGKWEMFE